MKTNYLEDKRLGKITINDDARRDSDLQKERWPAASSRKIIFSLISTIYVALLYFRPALQVWQGAATRRTGLLICLTAIICSTTALCGQG